MVSAVPLSGLTPDLLGGLSSARCEVKSGIAPVNPLAAFFGSWTTALLIERPPTAYVTGTQPNPHSSFIHLSTLY
jgi:hypothetical protein